jgi:glutamine synthetase
VSADATPLIPASHQGDYVIHTVEERGVRFVRLWFVDVLGLLKSFAIPVSELAEALEEGVGIDGSALEGSERLRERDAIAHLDTATFQVLPWRPDSAVARVFCDVRLPDGTPYPGDSRHALRRMLARAAELGYTFQVGPEIEFFLFGGPGDGEEPEPLDDGAYFDLTPLDVGNDFRRTAIEYLEQMGIPVKASHHEVAASQHEVDLHHTDALSMADAVTTFRLCVKEVARELGVYATFMPKPIESQAGSGMHVHLSLFEGDRNAFWCEDPDEPLSPVGCAFLAGLLAHAEEFALVTNQWVNSYKRIWGGSARSAGAGGEAPSYICWGHNNRSAMIRVPMYKPNKGQSTRIEVRSLDAAANPYLAYAVILAAGMKGIEEGYEVPREAEDDVWTLTERERTSMGIAPLPKSLYDAIAIAEKSELLAETLGEHVFDFFLRNKRAEWEEYRTQVSAFERDRMLPVL